MAYQLRENLSFCRVDDGLIFLDLDADRYFRLTVPLEAAFLDYLQGEGHRNAVIETLVRHNLLIAVDSTAHRLPEALPPRPSQSALELLGVRDATASFAVLEVFATVCYVQLQLKIGRISGLLATIATYRDRTASKQPFRHSSDLDAELLGAVHMFRRSRPYVPIDTCCLLDSTSLIAFLARRRIAASLVFGVTNRPFAAHCWVQREDWVLNDTVGNALAHTPIRTI